MQGASHPPSLWGWAGGEGEEKGGEPQEGSLGVKVSSLSVSQVTE